jgi:hypothetical protein
MRSKARSISSRVITRVGAMRMTGREFRCRGFPALSGLRKYRRACLCSSIPIHKPRPRTSFTAELRIVRNCSSKYLPRSADHFVAHAPERLIDVQNQAEIEGCGN